MIKILVIEDNEEIRDNTAELLELKGYHVETASNGRDGFEKAVNICPDIIISDMMMPEMDGFGLLKLIRAEKTTRNIPFIFFSANTVSFINFIKHEGDADEYLTKPFTAEELYYAVERCLDRNIAYVFRSLKEKERV
jgi:CRP/FNR family cyclic AMP-dependent transcriptional regulator